VTPPTTNPRADFVVPTGLATKLGVYGTSVLAIVALVTAVLDGDHTPETLIALATATIVLSTTIYGRMKQAAALYRDAPNSLQGLEDAITALNAPLDPPPSSITSHSGGGGTTLGR
jgi:hypothetical protein